LGRDIRIVGAGGRKQGGNSVRPVLQSKRGRLAAKVQCVASKPLQMTQRDPAGSGTATRRRAIEVRLGVSAQPSAAQ